MNKTFFNAMERIEKMRRLGYSENEAYEYVETLLNNGDIGEIGYAQLSDYIFEIYPRNLY